LEARGLRATVMDEKRNVAVHKRVLYVIARFTADFALTAVWSDAYLHS
jgi:hypothetical protein